ncbi:GTPase HflX [Derxia lacustris]|uniref:GTPase HflX n=1 Tax=Derxia lacustris TaxID=764842 RepID=UPI001F239ED4|nr:GTPase HflX [Derxia lacustris]
MIVGVDFGDSDFADSFDELELLAGSAGAQVVGRVSGKRSTPDPKHFVGSGKADEIRLAASADDCDLVMFNHALSPAQQRNLEQVIGLRVIDRTSLILDIFAQRAQSHEGKIQVELAQLQHLATRLVRGWTHLERQKGGIGLRGPGETQLETDRRLIGERVKQLRIKLGKLQAQRDTQRRARERRGTFSVSLIGYTNAGKSTLFNTLTRAKAYAADQLFATLDTTTRRIWIDGVGQVVLSDTVGFIRELPHQLVEAFKATLEETVHADLLLHVVDASSPSRHAQIAAVNAVLGEIGAADIPQMIVFNKADAAGLDPEASRNEAGSVDRIVLSARTGAGIDLLRAAIAERANASRPSGLVDPALPDDADSSPLPDDSL